MAGLIKDRQLLHIIAMVGFFSQRVLLLWPYHVSWVLTDVFWCCIYLSIYIFTYIYIYLFILIQSIYTQYKIPFALPSLQPVCLTVCLKHGTSCLTLRIPHLVFKYQL